MRWIWSGGCWEVADQNEDNGEWNRWEQAVETNWKKYSLLYSNRQWRCSGRVGGRDPGRNGNYKNSNISPQHSTYPCAVILPLAGWIVFHSAIVCMCVCAVSLFIIIIIIIMLYISFYLLLLTCVHHFRFVSFRWWTLIEKMFLIRYELCCAEIHNWIGTESKGERDGWQSNVTHIDLMALSCVCIGLRGWWLIRLNSGIWFDNVIFNQTNIKFITFY